MSDNVPGSGLPCLLVADDEPMLEQIVRRIVGDSYRVVSACDCATALAETVKEEPAIILLDVFMPDGSGTALCREIRSKLAGKPLQIILITGHPDDSAIQEGLDSGAD